MYSSYYVLSIQRPSQQPESRSLNQPVVTIGRQAGDIPLGDPLSSGRHAEIYFQNGQVYVRDVGSTNGTYFNGVRMPEFALQPGQSFQCGQTILTLMGIYGQQQQQQQAYPSNPALAATVAAAPAMSPPPQQAYQQQAYQQQAYQQQAYQQQAYQQPMQQPISQPMAQPGYGAPTPPPVMSPQQQPAGYGYGPPGQPQMPPPGYGQQPPAGAMVPAASPMPVPAGAQPMMPAPGQAMVGGVRVQIAVTGGELLGKLILGYLLTFITFGIYMPWFLVSLQRYLASRVTIGPTGRGNVRLQFTGSGGKLFVTFLLGYLLSVVTIGIYVPWFMCKIIKFFTENTVGTADDGTQVQLRFEATGGDLFVKLIVGYILCVLTIGIYMPWFICSLQRLFYSKTKLIENGQPIGGFEFSGTGGSLFGTFIVGYLLTMVTFGIYFAWFQTKLFKFFASNSRIDYHGHRYVGEFTGKGMDLFLIMLVGWVLIPLTIGIYFFWFLAKMLRFQFNNLVFHQMS